MPILDSRPLREPEDVRVLRRALGRTRATPPIPAGAEAMRAAARAQANKLSAPESLASEPHHDEPCHDEPRHDEPRRNEPVFD